MKSLVIGYGSIGKRHAKILNDLGHTVSVFTKYPDSKNYQFLSSLDNISSHYIPDYVVIANASCEHFTTYQKVRSEFLEAKILIEKPVSINHSDWNNIEDQKVFVGYNLRFHPLIQKLQSLIKEESLLSARLYVGQYLPDWRPDMDYRKSYSSKKELGGGVLFDLSHELDLSYYLFGPCKQLVASVSKVSDLEIDCHDTFQGIFEHKRCPNVTVEMNLIDKRPRRDILVHTQNHSIKVDFITNEIEIDNKVNILQVERNFSYQKQHEDILSNGRLCCSLVEGIETLSVIESINLSSKNKLWVSVNE